MIIDTYRYNSSSLPVWTPCRGWRAWSAGTSQRTSQVRGERRAGSTPNAAGQRSEVCTRRSRPSPPCTGHSAQLHAMTPPRGRSGGRRCPSSHWCALPLCTHPSGSCRETGREEVSDRCPRLFKSHNTWVTWADSVCFFAHVYNTRPGSWRKQGIIMRAKHK